MHVRDRVIQMDLTRRRAYGRVAEWAGPEALGRKNHAAHDDEARAMLDAYARGANAEIARLREAGQLAREYAHLSRHARRSAETAALCRRLLDWDGVMARAATRRSPTGRTSTASGPRAR
ncbi:Penicillin amidase [Salipiger thiooxidans]|uniref:Penicillin amidase n=2 Tax=Salipiger thiooxidans TaxID=282683 RepID=A0A1G7FP33_9RHOB|nr:Penicillin amidase [Salipiger thiooxidans]